MFHVKHSLIWWDTKPSYQQSRFVSVEKSDNGLLGEKEGGCGVGTLCSCCPLWLEKRKV